MLPKRAKVRYAGPKVFAALKETEGVADEGSEEEEEDYMHYGVIEASGLGVWQWLSKPFWDPILGFSVHRPFFKLYFSGDWDVHWGYVVLTHGHLGSARQPPCTQFWLVTV